MWRTHAVRLVRRSPRKQDRERIVKDSKKVKVIILLWDKVKEEGRMFLLITKTDSQSTRAIVPGRSMDVLQRYFVTTGYESRMREARGRDPTTYEALTTPFQSLMRVLSEGMCCEEHSIPRYSKYKEGSNEDRKNYRVSLTTDGPSSKGPSRRKKIALRN